MATSATGYVPRAPNPLPVDPSPPFPPPQSPAARPTQTWSPQCPRCRACPRPWCRPPPPMPAPPPMQGMLPRLLRPLTTPPTPRPTLVTISTGWRVTSISSVFLPPPSLSPRPRVFLSSPRLRPHSQSPALAPASPGPGPSSCGSSCWSSSQTRRVSTSSPGQGTDGSSR